MTGTPASLGYIMPAEWEKHDATWLSWPKDPNTFPPEILPKVEAAYKKMVESLSSGEEVRILVDDAKSEEKVRRKLGDGGSISFERIKTVDVWVRDYGPTYLRGKDLGLVKWVFNAWGNKYDDLLQDNESGEKLAESTGLKVFRPGIVLEGGSIDVNGRGSVMTTEQCLLNPNRNPGLNKNAIESMLEENLGVRNVIWLKAGIEGDDTDGHIDDIARFVGPRKIVVATEPDTSDSNHRALEEDLAILHDSTDEDSQPLEVIKLPMPRPVNSGDVRLPASHLNFHIGNSCVLVPTFGEDSDKEALRVLGDLFPRKEVVGVDCRALVYGLGTIHCITQQAPAPK
ncbi:MAG TPA: agmatine deiminase family protein [Nitrososphaerales archaeon]|nr:agmatine deiminase family protein [Nitrososphaerales archaeon]